MLRSNYDSSVAECWLPSCNPHFIKIRVMYQLIRINRRFAMLVLAVIVGLTPVIAGAAPGPTDKLQVLVNDTAVQLQLAYRQHPDERARRQEQLAASVAAWRAAPRSEANNARL